MRWCIAGFTLAVTLGQIASAHHGHPVLIRRTIHVHESDGASGSVTAGSNETPDTTPHRGAVRHHGHGHGHGQTGLATFNETDRELAHGPRVQSYLRFDMGLPVPKPVLQENLKEWERLSNELNQGQVSHGKLMLLHIVLMSLSFFGTLPISFILRAAKHPAHHAFLLLFLIGSLLGWSSGMVYSARSPDLYEGAVHGSRGGLTMIITLTALGLDQLRFLQRAFRTIKPWWLGNKPHYRLANTQAEKVGILSGTIATAESKWPTWRQASPGTRDSISSINSRPSFADDTPADGSRGDTQLFTTAEGPFTQRAWRTNFANAFSLAHKVFFRIVLVAVALMDCVAGTATYIGYGHAEEVLPIVGHVIPAILLVLWGVAGFLRYTDQFAQGGWVWNQQGLKYRGLSQDVVSCIALLIYAVITLVFEIRDYDSGDPRQTQHIALHSVICFIGGIGVLLESRVVQSLATLESDAGVEGDAESATRPVALNPCPAIVQGISGLVFLRHPQQYRFAIHMHQLFGAGLVLTSIFRLMTCGLSWTRGEDAHHKKAHYPPTEFLAAFTLSCTGFVVAMSTEELGFDAMRYGFDDSAIFMCIATAITSFIFFWLLFLKVIGAWALSRRHRVDI